MFETRQSLGRIRIGEQSIPHIPPSRGFNLISGRAFQTEQTERCGGTAPRVQGGGMGRGGVAEERTRGEDCAIQQRFTPTFTIVFACTMYRKLLDFQGETLNGVFGYKKHRFGTTIRVYASPCGRSQPHSHGFFAGEFFPRIPETTTTPLGVDSETCVRKDADLRGVNASVRAHLPIPH